VLAVWVVFAFGPGCSASNRALRGRFTAASTCGTLVPGARAERDALVAVGSFRDGFRSAGCGTVPPHPPPFGNQPIPVTSGFSQTFGPVCGTRAEPKAASQALGVRQLNGGRFVDGDLPGVFGASSIMDRGISPDAVGEAAGLTQVGAIPPNETGPTSDTGLYESAGFGLVQSPDSAGNAWKPVAGVGSLPILSGSGADGFAARAVHRDQSHFTQKQDRLNAFRGLPGAVPARRAQFASARENFDSGGGGGDVEGFGGPPKTGYGWQPSDESRHLEEEAEGVSAYGWLDSDVGGPALGPMVG
jgi:hypothetical protein